MESKRSSLPAEKRLVPNNLDLLASSVESGGEDDHDETDANSDAYINHEDSMELESEDVN